MNKDAAYACIIQIGPAPWGTDCWSHNFSHLATVDAGADLEISGGVEVDYWFSKAQQTYGTVIVKQAGE